MPRSLLRGLFGAGQAAATTVGANAGRATRTVADVNASARAHNVATRRVTHNVAVQTRAANRARRNAPLVGGRKIGADLVPFTGQVRETSLFDRLLGSEGSVRRKYTTRGLQVAGGAAGGSLVMNSVLGPRPPSSGQYNPMTSPMGQYPY